MDIDGQDWDDNSVMDPHEDEGLDGCPFGQMLNDETKKCVDIEGGYSDDEFNFGEGFSGDEFIYDEFDDSDMSLSEI